MQYITVIKFQIYPNAEGIAVVKLGRFELLQNVQEFRRSFALFALVQ